MNAKKALGWTLSFTAAASIAWAAGCSNNSKDTTTPARTSQKGEVCQTTNDCAPGLACVPNGTAGGVCEMDQFNVSATGKLCQEVQCAMPVDCCPQPPGGYTCMELQMMCADAGPFPPYPCSEYSTYCNCDGSKYNCTMGKCVPHCTMDSDCYTSGTGSKCNNGTCAQCAQDSDCTSAAAGSKCNNGVCMPPCTSDSDCPDFMRCNSMQCATSGCKTDRECVAFTKHVDSTCDPGDGGTCIIPCQTDTECGGSPEDYNFVSCINGTCTNVGCESDKDCELRNGGVPLPPPSHWVCQ